jgi:hypothetical protein
MTLHTLSSENLNPDRVNQALVAKRKQQHFSVVQPVFNRIGAAKDDGDRSVQQREEAAGVRARADERNEFADIQPECVGDFVAVIVGS